MLSLGRCKGASRVAGEGHVVSRVIESIGQVESVRAQYMQQKQEIWSWLQDRAHTRGWRKKKSRELDGGRASVTFYVRPSVYFILEMIGNYQYRVLSQRVVIRCVSQKAALVVLWKRYRLGASWNSQAPQRLLRCRRGWLGEAFLR